MWTKSTLLMISVIAGCVFVALFNIDFIGASIILPDMIKYYKVSLLDGQWLNNMFTASAAISFLIGTRFCQVFGLRRSLVTSTVLFSIFSLCCAMAPPFLWMIVSRLGVGLCCGVAYMAIILMAIQLFPPQNRGFVMGLIYGSMGVGMLVAPFTTTWLLTYWSWPIFFYCNAPIGFLLSIVFFYCLPADTFGESRGHLNAVSMILSGVAALLFFYGLTDWAQDSQDWPVLVLLVLGACVSYILVRRERVHADPIIPPSLFHSPSFLTSLFVRFVGQLIMMLPIIVIPLYLKNIVEEPELFIGAIMTTFTASIVWGSPIAGRLTDKWGAQIVNFWSLVMVLVSVGFAVWWRRDPSSTGMILLLISTGVCVAMNFTGTTISALVDTSAEYANQAMSVLFTWAVFGDVICLILYSDMSSVLARQWLRIHHFISRFHLSHDQADKVLNVLTGVKAPSDLLKFLPKEALQDLVIQVRGHFLNTVMMVFVLCGILAVIGIVLNARYVPKKSTHA